MAAGVPKRRVFEATAFTPLIEHEGRHDLREGRGKVADVERKTNTSVPPHVWEGIKDAATHPGVAAGLEEEDERSRGIMQKAVVTTVVGLGLVGAAVWIAKTIGYALIAAYSIAALIIVGAAVATWIIIRLYKNRHNAKLAEGQK